MTNLRVQLRQKLQAMQRECQEYKYITLAGRKYNVGLMSYNEHYIESYKENRKETDKHDENTLWELTDVGLILQLLVDNGDIKIQF
jgi:hypothetical protein